MKSIACLGALLILLVLVVPARVSARPELATLQNSPCSECHVNPTGGGMRNATGVEMSKALALEASTNAIQNAYPKFEAFTPMIGSHLQLGADVREGWIDQFKDKRIPASKQTWGSSFYLMQSQFYVDAQVLPVLHVVGGFDVAQNAFEAYGLVDGLPAGLYIRAGRFILPYGIRFDDHTAFTRDALGFSSTSEDTGLEIGVRPGPVSVSATLSNGLLGANGLDFDGDHYAFTGQASVRFWKFALGGGYFYNTRNKLWVQTYGPWLSFGIWRLALLGEFDLSNQEAPDAARPGKTTVQISSSSVADLEIELMQGLYFQARYTHRDPNWKVRRDWTDQALGGFLFYPMPFVSVTLQYRFNREDRPVMNDQLFAQAHFFF